MSEDQQEIQFDRTIGPLNVHVNIPKDPAVQDVADWFRGQKNMEARFASALRQSIDEVLDGQRTGRFAINQLEKTEKTYLGTKVEILLRTEFELASGGQKQMDYKIVDHPVDSKFTCRTTWSIPAEAISHICLLTKADDMSGKFSAGLIRIRTEILNGGRNQDGKTTISKSNWNQIEWLCMDSQLPKNLLQILPPTDIDAIMRQTSGQKRINELMRRAQGYVIDRTTSVTVAQQSDSLKRCRDARLDLRSEGIVVLGHQKQGPMVAKALQLPPLSKGEFISVRLTPLPDHVGPERPSAHIDGRRFAIAEVGEPIIEAPLIDQ